MLTNPQATLWAVIYYLKTIEMSFTKTNMVYNHYSWKAMLGDDPKISGVPDSTLFNRNEGYEVLYLIKKIMDSQSWVNVATGQKIEKMFKTGLPGE